MLTDLGEAVGAVWVQAKNDLTMRIRVFNDLHREYEPFGPDPTDHDLIALVGDIDLKGRGVTTIYSVLRTLPNSTSVWRHQVPYFGYTATSTEPETTAVVILVFYAIPRDIQTNGPNGIRG